jgi:Fe-S-cluster-containing hydrogenase component 2
MKVVRFLACVDEAKCIGDKLCENICPTGAIKIIQKKAKIDEERCVACRRCWDACQQDAIGLVVRSVPVILGIDLSDVEQARIKELCIKAHLHPKQLICLCTGTRVNEAAAAVLKGAKSPEEISLMTGARSGCTLYCLAPMLRLLKAHGIKISPPRGHRWYDITPTLWDVPREVEQRYPGYYFKQDIEIFRKF